MTNNNITTKVPASVERRIFDLESLIAHDRKQLRENSDAMTAEEILMINEAITRNEGVLKGIYFMLQELSLHI